MFKKLVIKRNQCIFTFIVLVLISALTLTSLSFAINSQSVYASSYSFNTASAVEYADTWWNSRNTAQYHDYGGVDCANFVSQALIAGGLNLRESPYVDSWGCIPSCDNLHSYLVNYLGVRYETKAKTDPPPSWFLPGDVAMFGDSRDPWQHSVFAVAVDSSGNTLVDAHSNNRYHVTIQFYVESSSSWSLCSYYNVTEAASLTPTVITLSDVVALKGKPVTAEAVISAGSNPLANVTIKFLIQQRVKNVPYWVNVSSSVSNSSGKATISIPAKSITMDKQPIKAIFVGDGLYSGSVDTALILRQ